MFLHPREEGIAGVKAKKRRVVSREPTPAWRLRNAAPITDLLGRPINNPDPIEQIKATFGLGHRVVHCITPSRFQPPKAGDAWYSWQLYNQLPMRWKSP